jgi:hypothetical protein
VTRKAAITVLGARAEVERRWGSSGERPESATFQDAPGDRGTEIHVESGKPWTLAKTKEELRRFKQEFETGETPRSDGAPDGDRVERLLKQRPAQPLTDTEREKVLA